MDDGADRPDDGGDRPDAGPGRPGAGADRPDDGPDRSGTGADRMDAGTGLRSGRGPTREEAAEAVEAVEDALVALLRSGRTNALAAWVMVGVLALVLAESVLDVDLQWTVFVAFVGVLVAVPPVAYRDWRVMLPWELLVLALLPILVRGLFRGEVGTFATYVSVAALALIVVVEFHSFTGLQVTHWFAVALVVLTTLAAAAGWTMVRWNVDRYFGTGFLTTNDALMREFLWVALAGLAAGVVFDVYFRRRQSLARRAVARVIRR